jgi:electron transfer flavoprotein alpha subunit
MSGNVWVVVDHWKGAVSDVTFETLALGRGVADALGVRLEAVLLGQGIRELSGSLGVADAVLYVDHPALADSVGEPTSRALASLAADRAPSAVLVPATNVTWDLLGLLPARLGAPFVNFCQDIAVVDGVLQATCLVYGGKMQVTVTGEASPVVLEDVSAEVPEDSRLRLLEYEEPEVADIDISQQDVLVAVGRGIGGEANLEVAEDLADALGGAVCGSRPVIDQAWLPLARQVGKSGVTVKPRLYVAAGISGAPEHLEGMRDSETIIAVNTDADAPIFSVAHYGVVDDAADVLEALAEAVRKRKG